MTAFLAASVVAAFEGTISQVTALAVFMPIVAGMGGNAATQTLTVVVRGLALGELSWANARKALIKEAGIGLGNGLVLGTVAALVAWVTKGSPMLGLLLGMAMVCNMLVATTAGTLVPLGLKAMKVDPALGLVGVHHHLHRRRRLCLVPGPGDDLPALPRADVGRSGAGRGSG